MEQCIIGRGTYLLSNSVHGLLCVRSHVDRDDACICNSNIACPVDDKAIVNYSTEVQWSHRSCTNGVVDWLEG